VSNLTINLSFFYNHHVVLEATDNPNLIDITMGDETATISLYELKAAVLAFTEVSKNE